MGLVLLGKEEHSKMRQKCVKNARNTFGGEHLLDDTEFWKCAGGFKCLVSRGRCGRKIARLRRLRLWSLRASLRLPKSAATFFVPRVCDWYARSPIGQCHGVQSYPQETRKNVIPIGCFEHGAQFLISGLKALAPWLKDRTRLASFCSRGPKADMPSQGIRA